MATTPASAAPRRSWKKIILISLAALLVIGVVLIALAPTIASSIAPGKFETAAAEQIKGKVKVDGLSLGWFSPTSVGPVHIIDPEGKTAATVTVKSPATLWKIVSERWWSASKLDAGEVEISGALDLIRDAATGETNLGRALAPRVAAAKPGAAGSGAGGKGTGGGGSSGGLESVKASLKIVSLDALVRDRDAAGTLGPQLGVKGLKGPINVEYVAKPMTLIASADLSGSNVGATDALKVKLDANVKPKSGGGLDSFKVSIDVAGAPVSLVDALANQHGALVQALGARAAVQVAAYGTAQAGTAKVFLTSEGANARLNLTLKDGMLVATEEPVSLGNAVTNRITIRSTEFLASLPALREAMGKAGQQVTLAKAPGMEITIETLRWPVPAEMLGGSAGADAMGKADFRAASLSLKARVDAMSGQIAIPQSASGASSTAASAMDWKSFAVEPIELTVQAADFSKPIAITGGTKATIDGSPAGDLSIRAGAAGLLDAQGHLRALAKTGLADTIDADIRVQGMSTALLQPFIAGANLPINLAADVGPVMNLGVQAKADAKSLTAANATDIPPTDFTLSMTSNNIRASGVGRFDKGVITLTGEGLTAEITSAAPLTQRLMNKPGQAGSLELSGVGEVSLKVKDFAAPLDKLKSADALAAVKALITCEVSNLGVKPGDAPADGQPVMVKKTALSVRLDGANPPQIDMDSSLSHEGSPFDLTGQIRLDGIKGGKLPASAAGAAQIIAFKPTGKVELKSLPRSALNLVPSTANYGTGALAGNDMPGQISRAVRESIGRTATLTITTQPDGAAQSAAIKLTTEAGGVGADIAAKLTDKAVIVSSMQAFAGMDPKIVNPVLASANASSGGGGESATRSVAVPNAPLQLAQAFKITLASTEAMTVPLQAGTFEPDFAGASDAIIKIAADNDIAIDNVPAGTDSSGAARTTGVRVKSLKADVKAPLSGLAPGQMSKRLNATFAALAERGGDERGAGASKIADITGTAQAGMDGTSPDVTLKIASIDCAVVENLIGKPGLLTGALGATANADLRILPQNGGQAISASLTAPNVSDAKLDLMQSADKIAITKPSTITWRPDHAFLNKMLFAPAPGQAAGSDQVSINHADAITINIAKFTMSASKTENGQQTAGPLKPGVFELDASIAMPAAALSASHMDSVQGTAMTPSLTAINLDGLKAAVKYQPATGATGFGEVVADLTIDKVSNGTAAAGNAAGKKSTATIRVANLADARGVLTTNAAVVNLNADLAAFPTQIVDSLAHQKGILAELLGPTIDMQAKGTNLVLGAGGLATASGSVELKATSPRASADVKGDLHAGMFTQTGTTGAKVTQITPQLVKQLAGALPLVETIEKTAQDEPATLNATTLSIPLDSDLTKLNGDFMVSPGVARFTTKSIFGDLIEALGGKSAGALGQHIEPFKVHAAKGVLTYEKFTLPVGSFSVETRGTVDLVNRQINVVTYAPIGSLTSKALGDLNTGIAGKLGLLDKSTGVPITTKGPLDNSKTEIDFGLFLKEQADKLLKDPGKLIGALGDLLGGGKKGGDATPTPNPATPVAPDNTPKAPSSAPPQQPPAPKPAPKPADPGTQPPTNPSPAPTTPPAKPKPKPKPKPDPTPTPAPKP